jgi:hypothetical protein
MIYFKNMHIFKPPCIIIYFLEISAYWFLKEIPFIPFLPNTGNAHGIVKIIHMRWLLFNKKKINKDIFHIRMVDTHNSIRQKYQFLFIYLEPIK